MNKRYFILLLVIPLMLFCWTPRSLWMRNTLHRITPINPPSSVQADSGFFKYLYADSFSTGSMILPPTVTFDSLTVRYWLNLMNNTTVVDNSGNLFMRKINSGSQFLNMMLGSTFYIDKYDNFSHARQDLTLSEYTLRFWGGHQDSIIYRFNNRGIFDILNASNGTRISLNSDRGIDINAHAFLNDTMLFFNDGHGNNAKLRFGSSITELFSNNGIHIWQTPNSVVNTGITLTDSGTYINYSNTGLHTFSNFAVKNTEFIWNVSGITVPIYTKLGANGFEINAIHAHDTNRIYMDPDYLIKTNYACLDIGGGNFYLQDTTSRDTFLIANNVRDTTYIQSDKIIKQTHTLFDTLEVGKLITDTVETYYQRFFSPNDSDTVNMYNSNSMFYINTFHPLWLVNYSWDNTHIPPTKYASAQLLLADSSITMTWSKPTPFGFSNFGGLLIREDGIKMQHQNVTGLSPGYGYLSYSHNNLTMFETPDGIDSAFISWGIRDSIYTSHAWLDIGGGRLYLRDTTNQDTLKIYAQNATTLLWKIISAQPISIESDTLIELLGFPLKINGNVFVFYEDSAYLGNLLPHTNAGYSIGNSNMRWFSMWAENYYGIESNSSDSFRLYINNDTMNIWSTRPIRLQNQVIFPDYVYFDDSIRCNDYIRTAYIDGKSYNFDSGKFINQTSTDTAYFKFNSIDTFNIYSTNNIAFNSIVFFEDTVRFNDWVSFGKFVTFNDSIRCNEKISATDVYGQMFRFNHGWIVNTSGNDSIHQSWRNDTFVISSTCPVRIDSLVGGGGNQGWTMGCGDTLIGISPDCADSFYLFDDGDTTRLISDNPIKIGEGSFVVADSYNISTKPLSIGEYPPSGAGWLEVLSEDTIKANALYNLASMANPAINYNVFINSRSWFKSGVFVSVADSIDDTLSCIRVSDMVNDGGVGIGLYASVPVIGAENPVWSIFVPSNSAPSHFGMVYTDSMQFTKIWGSCLTVTGDDALCSWSIYVPPSPEGFPANISILYSDTIYVDKCKVESLSVDRLTVRNSGDSTVIEDIVYVDSSLYIITSSPVNDTFIINGRNVFVDTVIDTLNVGINSIVYTRGTVGGIIDQMASSNRIFQGIAINDAGDWITHSLLPLGGDSIQIDSMKIMYYRTGTSGSGDSVKISLLQMTSALWDSVVCDTFIDVSGSVSGINTVFIPCTHTFKSSPRNTAINIYFWRDDGTASYYYRGLVIFYKRFDYSELTKR